MWTVLFSLGNKYHFVSILLIHTEILKWTMSFLVFKAFFGSYKIFCIYQNLENDSFAFGVAHSYVVCSRRWRVAQLGFCVCHHTDFSGLKDYGCSIVGFSNKTVRNSMTCECVRVYIYTHLYTLNYLKYSGQAISVRNCK